MRRTAARRRSRVVPSLICGTAIRTDPSPERRAVSEKKDLATNAGAPVPDNQNVMTAGPRGSRFVQEWQRSFR